MNIEDTNMLMLLGKLSEVQAKRHPEIDVNMYYKQLVCLYGGLASMRAISENVLQEMFKIEEARSQWYLEDDINSCIYSYCSLIQEMEAISKLLFVWSIESGIRFEIAPLLVKEIETVIAPNAEKERNSGRKKIRACKETTINRLIAVAANQSR